MKVINKIQKIKENKKTVYMAVSMAGVISAMVLAVILVVRLDSRADRREYPPQSRSGQAEKREKPLVNGEARLLDGVIVPKEEANLMPWAVMIDNHQDAWPPCGLDRANLVYEAEAEGGMTRYLALFSGYAGQDIEKIGPIRSARPYFADIAKEYSALYVHVGGSPEALVKIKQEWIPDINEFYNEHYFWRDESRFAPHNVMSSSRLLEKYMEDKKIYSEPNFFPWRYSEPKSAAERPENSIIKIDFSLRDYKVEWHYDKPQNRYERYLNGLPHKTEEGKPIYAKNIVLQTIDAEEIDDELRLRMDIVGNGKMRFCREGLCRSGTWEKESAAARTRFYIDGQEAEFLAGTTWIEVVRPEITATIL